MKKIFSQLLTSHLVITIIVIILSASMPHVNESLIIIGFTICALYFFSGYWLTKEKVKWHNYFGVAIIGIAMWMVCFVISPNSMDYKRNSGAGIWFLYQLYIFVSSPLNFISILNEKHIQLLIDLLIPVFISALQFFGGRIKLHYLNNPDEAN